MLKDNREDGDELQSVELQSVELEESGLAPGLAREAGPPLAEGGKEASVRGGSAAAP